MDDREIIAEFVIESRDHLADIENQLLAIESAGTDADPDLVNTVFRAIHSVKGAAGFLGFSTIGHLAHDLENVLNLIRNRQLIPNGAITDVLLRSSDRLRSLIDDIDHSNGSDISNHLEALQAIVSGLLTEEAPVAVFQPETPVTATAKSSEVSESRSVSTSDDASTALGDTPDALAPPAESPPTGAAVLPSTRPQQRAPENATNSSGSAGGTVGDSNIRVSVTVLDRLMNLAGELVLSRNQLLQTLGTADQAAVGTAAARVDQVTSELQETIMQTRLQPIGTVFGRFARVVRDLSNTLGKQCQLTLEGQEVELDKSIIEAIGDPLTHLIRNAVDHGVEGPDARVKQGKSPMGSLALRAFHQAGKVNIQISDDGRGIDAARLKEKAVAKGLITPDQARAMSDRESLLLIFRPGFSMAERVTEVSGRGVGMDVVKTNIERLGGTVSIDTELGKGTTINVKLPLTLAIIPSLVVRCADRRYAIPQGSIRELVRVRASEVAKRIERVKHAEVFRLRGALLPLVRLSKTLQLHTDASSTDRAVHIIVVEAGHVRYGLVVDGLCDSEEIVVKPLGRHMKGCQCLAGATILGDGKVALILDIAGIAAHSQLTFRDDDVESEVNADDKPAETLSLLLFNNHPAEHFGVPMESVTRLERVRAEQIDSVGGQQILQYRGGTLPLLSLEDCIGCKPRPENSRMYVVVYTTAHREVGLIVPELLDIREVPPTMDTQTFREAGVVGSLVYDRLTVRLLDLHELTRKCHPDWYESLPVVTPVTRQKSRVLVVEDSDFFRRQLVSALESEGYEVESSKDGLAAWELLQTPSKEFDIVVTDIEMPRMDGLDLARHVRKDPHLETLPIIAVTSLAGEDDCHRGEEAGFNDYQIKLDRECADGIRFPVAERVVRAEEPCMTTALATSPTSMGSDELEVASFYIGESLMGIAIEDVEEIRHSLDLTPVPHSPAYVRGVMNLRGGVVTVIDLRTMLGMPPMDSTGKTCNIVVRSGAERIGLLADRVGDVICARRREIEPPPANVGGADGRFFRGVYKLDEELLIILDVERLLNDDHASK